MSIQTVKEIISDVCMSSLEHPDNEYADRFADKCIKLLCDQLRGTYVYIPASTVNKEQRNREIKEEFNGQNIRKLCRKHKLSSMRIYQILNDKSQNNK